MTGLRSTRLLIVALTPTVLAASGEDEQVLQVGRACVEVKEPDVCMASYGFECSRGRVPRESRQAEFLSCNLDLGDGRAHFVQMSYDGGGWKISHEETYVREYEEERIPQEHPDLALAEYLRRQMGDYNVHGSGSGTYGDGNHSAYEVGVRRQGGVLQVRMLCGLTDTDTHDETASTQWKDECAGRVHRTIRSLSQSRPAGPYRVANSSEIDWQRRSATLLSGDRVLVLDGRYSFAAGHRPCRFVSDCCSEDGILYLQSCRSPTGTELQAIDDCLEAGHGGGSDGLVTCLRAAGIKVGCEVQDDGSNLCY